MNKMSLSRLSQSPPPGFDFLGRIVHGLVNARRDKFEDVDPEIVYSYAKYLFSQSSVFFDWLMTTVNDQSSGQTIIRHDPTGSGVKGRCWYFILEREGKSYEGYIGPYVPPFGLSASENSALEKTDIPND